MILFSYFYCKPILKISQTEGLRDTKYGCTFESSDFIKAVEMSKSAGIWEVNDDGARQD